jgi:prevent-host-death family protein
MTCGFNLFLFINELHMEKQVTKSKFKPQALHYFREVERTGRELIITDRGKPVLKIVRYSENPYDDLKMLRNTVITYENPTEPVGMGDWEALG